MKETIKMLRDSLAQIYPKGEAEAIIRIIFEYLKGWSPVDIAIHGDEELSPFIRGKVNGILERLKECRGPGAFLRTGFQSDPGHAHTTP